MYFLDVFSFVPIIFPSPEIFDRAIHVRKLYHLKLGNSLIAATALVHELTLYTRNLRDFEKVAGLKCINPIK
jgi:predicted nucleic acid-binding protein